MRTLLQLQRRNIEVNGKAASVYGIGQPDGTFGLVVYDQHVAHGLTAPF
jgi:hypothetical protein